MAFTCNDPVTPGRVWLQDVWVGDVEIIVGCKLPDGPNGEPGGHTRYQIATLTADGVLELRALPTKLMGANLKLKTRRVNGHHVIKVATPVAN